MARNAVVWVRLTVGCLVLAFVAGAWPSAAAATGAPDVVYRSAQGEGFARAYCPAKSKVIGGGAFVEDASGLGAVEASLRQSHPISDKTGVIAFGNTAIGWQGASSDFEDTVVAFAVCATPKLASALTVHYVSDQAMGMARAFCPTGTTLTGGGAFVEDESRSGAVGVQLRQSHAIADAGGQFAYGTTATGWQAASSDFEDIVVPFAICAASNSGAPLGVEYVSAQATGLARAACPAGKSMSGGGGLVEDETLSGAVEVMLRQTHPIADLGGEIAHGTRGTAWQVASSNFEDIVVSFAICGAF